MWDKRDKRVIFLFQYYIHAREGFRKQMGVFLGNEKVTFSREKVVFTILKVTFSALKVILLHINMRINIHCHGG